MNIDGKAVAESIYIELAERRKAIQGTVGLGIVVASHDPVIESFVRIKSRAARRLNVELRRLDLLNQPQTADALSAIERLGPKVGGIIVQLPLPEALDTDAILSAIPPFLDVDGINPTVIDEGRFVLAPVAGAIEQILKRSNIDVTGKRCVVVGAGRLVGAPAAHLMRKLGAEVSVVTLESGSLEELKDADVVILGAGNPGFVKPEMIKDGVVLIDAGTSEQGGKVRGDADPSCAEKCSLFTPVPGGLGPIAVAMIFKNLFDLVEKAG
ncbi:MAG: FolD bifunctional protein methylenetetrahydrofolate dehydrogenase [Candidatus Kaiserbacteria bacterium]|nr:FolD bifunctional protein methylenetetrahydrofolate dehydrogenase [Candidatus Kaiserbacteria bacterium]